MQLEHIRAEIERMRKQIHRQRGEIKQLQRAGISTLPAEALLARMQTTVDNLCAERDKLVGGQRRKYDGKGQIDPRSLVVRDLCREKGKVKSLMPLDAAGEKGLHLATFDDRGRCMLRKLKFLN